MCLFFFTYRSVENGEICLTTWWKYFEDFLKNLFKVNNNFFEYIEKKVIRARQLLFLRLLRL